MPEVTRSAGFPRMAPDGTTLEDREHLSIRVREDADPDARFRIVPEGTPGARRVRGPTETPVYVVVDRQASIEANREALQSPYASTFEKVVDRLDIARHRFHQLFGR